MATYLVESYEPLLDVDELSARLDRCAAAVRPLEATLVIADETCFYVFEADSTEAAKAAAEAVGIRVARISEAVHLVCAPGNGRTS